MWGTKLYYKHKWVIDGVVEEGSREGEVSGPNPTDRVARDFTRKMRDLRLDGDGRFASGAFPRIKIFFFYF